MADVAEKRLLEEGYVKSGDVVGIVAGTPLGIRGTTNFMKLHVIGKSGRVEEWKSGRARERKRGTVIGE
jgi:hypothetical protein